MPISVFPERMDKLDPEDVNASLRTLETYIHYICERTEYAITNTFRTTNGLGSSAEAISLVLQEAVDDLSSLTGEVGALASAVNGKVDKVEGMGLSSNDYTDADKEDVDAIDGLADRVTNLEEHGGEANVIEIVKRNGTALPVVGKAVDVTVPTNVGELTNDSGYQNAQQVQAAVSAGLAFLLISETYGPAAMVSFSSETEGLPLKKCQVDIAPVQAGSGDPSPSNVRAITGWTGARVQRFVKNYAPQAEVTLATGDGNKSIDFVAPLPAGDYTFSSNLTSTYQGGCLLHVVKRDNTYQQFSLSPGSRVHATFTSSAENPVTRLRFYVGSNYRTSRSNSGSWSKLQVESGSTETAYEPCDVIDEAFPLTVYGGVLDVLAGILTVTYGHIASYAGESLPGAWISDRDIYIAGASPSAGAQVAYELADPVIYQLTPQMVTTLAGMNNIWADTGDVTVERGAYLAALQAEIERLQEGGN